MQIHQPDEIGVSPDRRHPVHLALSKNIQLIRHVAEMLRIQRPDRINDLQQRRVLILEFFRRIILREQSVASLNNFFQESTRSSLLAQFSVPVHQGKSCHDPAVHFRIRKQFGQPVHMAHQAPDIRVFRQLRIFRKLPDVHPEEIPFFRRYPAALGKNPEGQRLVQGMTYRLNAQVQKLQRRICRGIQGTVELNRNSLLP